MRAVSSSLAATDRAHHFDFINSAENYRRQFVEDLNVAEMKKQKPGDSPDQRRQFWAQVTEFLPDLRRTLLQKSIEQVRHSRLSLRESVLVALLSRSERRLCATSKLARSCLYWYLRNGN